MDLDISKGYGAAFLEFLLFLTFYLHKAFIWFLRRCTIKSETWSDFCVLNSVVLQFRI